MGSWKLLEIEPAVVAGRPRPGFAVSFHYPVLLRPRTCRMITMEASAAQAPQVLQAGGVQLACWVLEVLEAQLRVVQVMWSVALEAQASRAPSQVRERPAQRVRLVAGGEASMEVGCLLRVLPAAKEQVKPKRLEEPREGQVGEVQVVGLDLVAVGPQVAAAEEPVLQSRLSSHCCCRRLSWPRPECEVVVLVF